jgi:hypothetical protein
MSRGVAVISAKANNVLWTQRDALGQDYIEAHRVKPLSALEEGQPVTYDAKADFVVFCANCHRLHEPHEAWRRRFDGSERVESVLTGTPPHEVRYRVSRSPEPWMSRALRGNERYGRRARRAHPTIHARRRCPLVGGGA